MRKVVTVAVILAVIGFLGRTSIHAQPNPSENPWKPIVITEHIKISREYLDGHNKDVEERGTSPEATRANELWTQAALDAEEAYASSKNERAFDDRMRNANKEYEDETVDATYPKETPAPQATESSSCETVWVNTNTGIYHFPGERWYGNTREGKYECRSDADAEGDRPTENGQ